MDLLQEKFWRKEWMVNERRMDSSSGWTLGPYLPTPLNTNNFYFYLYPLLLWRGIIMLFLKLSGEITKVFPSSPSKKGKANLEREKTRKGFRPKRFLLRESSSSEFSPWSHRFLCRFNCRVLWLLVSCLLNVFHLLSPEKKGESGTFMKGGIPLSFV